MKYHLGIDFGAENVMAMALPVDSKNPLDVKFADSKGDSAFYMPNCVAQCSDGNVHVGWEARGVLGDDPSPKPKYFHRYKQYLNGSVPEDSDLKGDFAPKKLMRTVLQFVLEAADMQIREQHMSSAIITELAGLVVTVPVGWDEGESRAAYLEVLGELGVVDKARLVAEPVAAAAWLIGSPMFQGVDHWPLNFMVVDIGACTLDVSVCTSHEQPPLQVLKGSSSYYAGYKFDKELESLFPEDEGDELPIERLLRAEQQKKEISSRYDSSGRAWDRISEAFNRAFKRDLKSRIEKIIQKMAAEAVKSVDETFAGLNKGNWNDGKQIDCLIFCGGMSRFTAYREAIEKTVLKKYGNFFSIKNSSDALRSQISDDGLQRSIARGAVYLSVNPGLVTEQLGYEIGICPKIEYLDKAGKKCKEECFINVVPETHVLDEHKQFYSLKKAVAKARREGGMLNGLIIDDLYMKIDNVETTKLEIQISNRNLPKRIRRQLPLDRRLRTIREIRVMGSDKPIAEEIKKKYDLRFSVSVNGAVLVELLDDRSHVVGKHKITDLQRLSEIRTNEIPVDYDEPVV